MHVRADSLHLRVASRIRSPGRVNNSVVCVCGAGRCRGPSFRPEIGERQSACVGRASNDDLRLSCARTRDRGEMWKQVLVVLCFFAVLCLRRAASYQAKSHFLQHQLHRLHPQRTTPAPAAINHRLRHGRFPHLDGLLSKMDRAATTQRSPVWTTTSRPYFDDVDDDDPDWVSRDRMIVSPRPCFDLSISCLLKLWKKQFFNMHFFNAETIKKKLNILRICINTYAHKRDMSIISETLDGV